MSSGQPPLILHVIHHLFTGGMENGLVNIINYMPRSAFRHVIACIEDYSDFSERLTGTDTEVIALHRSRVGVWRLRRDLLQLCRRLRPAIIHTRNQSGLDALLPARLAGVRRSVHSEHGWDVHDLRGTRVKPALLRRLHSPLIDRYITVSRDLEMYLVRRVGIAPTRITQIYNGVDTARFAPATAKPSGMLPMGFAEQDSILIGTVGRLQRVKDQASLLRAFASVVQADAPDARRARLAIIGDGPLMGELRSLAEALGIAGRTWFAGAINNAADVLRTFDMFVLPSLNEGISNTILEAMATGLPVIATAVGGNVELVEDRVSGRFFEAGDTPGLTRVLTEFLSSAVVRREYGARARDTAVARFSIDRMVSKYRAVYEELLQDGLPRARAASLAMHAQSRSDAGQNDG